MYSRILDLKTILKRKSIFLLGPRQTGKSTLIKNFKEPFHFINLLQNGIFLRYQNDPDLLTREFSHKKSELIIIDEIQRLPELLNCVHLLIEDCQHRFLLTGSSARKLRKAGVNLLGGRAKQIFFSPLVSKELGKDFNLIKALSFGLLPSIYSSVNPSEDLEDYVGTYLKEEIQAEGAVRNIPSFSRLLQVAATCSGEMINYSKIASDAQMSPSTTREHFQILYDTLVAIEVPSFFATVKRKAIQTSKFYFFDLGVVRAILKRGEIKESDADFGRFFEAFIFQELNTFSNYNSLSTLKYWRSTSDYEVDFILDDKMAIEVKATKKVSKNDLKNLLALKEENLCTSFYLVTRDTHEQIFDGIHCLCYKTFLDKLWEKTLE